MYWVHNYLATLCYIYREFWICSFLLSRYFNSYGLIDQILNLVAFQMAFQKNANMFRYPQWGFYQLPTYELSSKLPCNDLWHIQRVLNILVLVDKVFQVIRIDQPKLNLGIIFSMFKVCLEPVSWCLIWLKYVYNYLTVRQ